MFAPVTQALTADAQIASQRTVLDIATGPGEPALSGRRGWTGRQSRAIDLAPEMIAAARREADRLGLGNTQFEVAFADHLPLLALAVWHFSERNPCLSVVSRIVDRHVDTPPLAPDAPDTYRFAEPRKLLAILCEAGVNAPSERVFQFTIEAAVSVEDFWTMRCEMSEKLRDALATLSSEQLTVVKREAFEALRQYSMGGGMCFPAEVLIVSGSKH